QGTLHGTGLQIGYPAERAVGGGTLLRPAGRSLRSKVEGSSGLPAPCVGGAGETGRDGATSSPRDALRRRGTGRSESRNAGGANGGHGEQRPRGRCGLEPANQIRTIVRPGLAP